MTDVSHQRVAQIASSSQPPASRPEIAKATEIARNTLVNLELVVPGVSRLKIQVIRAPEVMGGVIYALGDTDVDDPNSGFHSRSGIGLRSSGNYHSVDTGKYTTAPIFAVDVADRVTSSS